MSNLIILVFILCFHSFCLSIGFYVVGIVLMNVEEKFYNRRLLSNGQRLLDNFYSRRRSLEPLVSIEDMTRQRQQQQALKSKLSIEYIKLLKENNHLRDFISNYHVRVKGKRIHSVLDKLKSNKNENSITGVFDSLHKRISQSPIF